MCFRHGFLRVFLNYISYCMYFPIFARIYTMNLKHLTHTGSPSVIIKEEMPYILISWWTTGTDLRSRLSGSQSQYTGCNVTCPLRRLPGPCVGMRPYGPASWNSAKIFIEKNRHCGPHQDRRSAQCDHGNTVPWKDIVKTYNIRRVDLCKTLTCGSYIEKNCVLC